MQILVLFEVCGTIPIDLISPRVPVLHESEKDPTPSGTDEHWDDEYPRLPRVVDTSDGTITPSLASWAV